MTIVGLAGESQTRTQSPSLVRKSLIISMKIMMIILLLILMMAFIMRGGHDNDNEIGNSDNKNNCRCVLLGKMFVYFRNPNEQNPVGQLNMRDSRVEEVVTSFSCLFLPSWSSP